MMLSLAYTPYPPTHCPHEIVWLGVNAWMVVFYRILMSAKDPLALGVLGFLNLVGLLWGRGRAWGGLWTKGLGLGPYNKIQCFWGTALSIHLLLHRN